MAQTPSFAPIVAIGTGVKSNPTSVAVADVNGDGKPDVLTANFSTSTVGVLLGNGLGGFTLQANSPSTGGSPSTNGVSGPQGVAVADVNGDGKPDVLTANYYTSTVSVLLGNGLGGFTLQANSPSTGNGSAPYSIAVADVNGDGKLDVLTANIGASTVGVLLGDGLGGFTLQANSPSTGNGSAPRSVVVADVNGDGKPDVLTANSDSNTIGVLLGNGLGGFTLQANSPSTGSGSAPYSIAVADVNGDGKLDVLTANLSTSTVGVLLGNGLGGFTLQANSPSTGEVFSGPLSVAVADVNGDKNLDVLTVNTGRSNIGVLLGNGSAGFTLQANSPTTGMLSGPYNIAVADVNGDGRPDMLVANYNTNTVGVLLNTTPVVLATSAGLTSATVSVYPNPAHDYFIVVVPGMATARAVRAELLNAFGQRIHQQVASLPTAGTRLVMSTTGLAGGVYVLRLTVNHKVLTKRVVIR